jgi:lipooligosaccharide transport system permease protein
MKLFYALLLRRFLGWRPYIKNFLFLSVADPILFLYAFGMGMGAMFGADDYMLFAATGMVSGVVIWSVLLDATYNSITTVQNGIWQSMLAATVPLRRLLWAENIFASTRVLISCLAVLLVSMVFVTIPNPLGFVWAIPIIFMASMAIHASGQCLASLARGYPDMDFMWPLYGNPMFLFSGIFVTVGSFPEVLQKIGQVFPLYHAVSTVRPMLMGTATLQSYAFHFAVLFAMWAAFSTLAHHMYKRRLCS